MLSTVALLLGLLGSLPTDALDCQAAIDRVWSECSVADFGAGLCVETPGLSDECAGWETPAERAAELRE